MTKKHLLILVAALLGVVPAWAETRQVSCGMPVTIKATPATGYHFVQWDDGNTDNPRTVTPTADASYKAMFAINRYTITFQNWDGTELQRDELDYNADVSYRGTEPTRPPTDEWTYTFSGWSPNVSYKAVDNATYVAQYDQTRNKYTITFVNWDGTELQSSEWEYGTTPTYSGSTPTRPESDGQTYTFSGWGNISPVTGNKTYTAQYNGETNSYELVLTAGENGTVSGGGIYQHGTSVQITATPSDACYHFVQWSDGDTNANRTLVIMGDLELMATFELNTYTIEVVSDDDSQGQVSIQ